MISSVLYRQKKLKEEDASLETLAAARKESDTVMWVNLSAPTKEEIKQVLEQLFGFHPLAIEDCVSDSPAPKLEPYDEYIYLVMHAVVETTNHAFEPVELDIFIGKNYLVTYHREPLPFIDRVMVTLAQTPDQTISGPDRLAQHVLDAMIESYRPLMENLRCQVERAEEGVLGEITAAELFPKIVSLRKRLSRIRRVMQPEEDVIDELCNKQQPLIGKAIAPYLRDLSQELHRIDAQAGAWGEQLILSFRLYLNKTTHEANEGIRVLTGLTAVTFPTLLVGSWFGMNFKNMHELKMPFGYPLAIALTVLLTGATWLYMRRKGWI